jgi:high-affinity iron transporter
MIRIIRFVGALALLLSLLHIVPAYAQERPLSEQVRGLITHTKEGVEAAENNRPELMHAEYQELEAIWGSFEGQVRERDPKGYVDLEEALDGIKDAVNAKPIDPAAVKAAYTHLGDEAAEVADRLGAASSAAPNAGLAAQVRGLTHQAEEGAEAAEQNNPGQLKAEYQEIEAAWGTFEDQVRTQDTKGYADLEAAIDAIKDAVNATPLNTAAAAAAYDHLKAEATEVADRIGAAAPAAAVPAVQGDVTPAELIRLLDTASASIKSGAAADARAQLDSFIRAWPAAEDAIATRSNDDYKAIESGMGRAAAALRAEPADLATASTAIAQMRTTLERYTTASSYTAFDAAAIILREGLEALLVVVALLAFLRKSGNSDKRGWIWVGGALGVVASLITAFILQAIFSQVSAGRNRELIEGATGLVAAALLFYVSYWLHSKASLHAWQKYINQQTSQALARGSMAGLALLSFLAVFREGAETAVFYLGMAPAIELRDLLLGIAGGTAILVIAAVLMLVVGVKLPLRPFFRVAGLLVYYLGFKFVGTGIHALQVAGVIPTSPIGSAESIPVLEFFGIFLTWQTLVPQLVLLVGAAAAFMYLRALDRRSRALGTPAAI